MINRSSLEKNSKDGAITNPIDNAGFDMIGYLASHKFPCFRGKPWSSQPGGTIYELEVCPFDQGHTNGSAAFSMVNGEPGFSCHHNGCKNRTIKDVFAAYPPKTNWAKGENRQSQFMSELISSIELFHTPEGEPYACLPVNAHQEVWPLKHKAVRNWITHAIYRKFQKATGSQSLQEAIALLEAKAQFDCQERPIFVRVAPGPSNSIYIDLGNPNWESVEITAIGWKVVQDAPVRFRRPRGMKPLPNPRRGGAISKLRQFINAGAEENWILLLSWLVAAFRPVGPYPLLVIQGEQGSAKSTTARFIRRLVDPIVAPVRTAPRDERDLLVAASNSWVLAFDNLSGLPPWLSDALCRLSTGGGFSTRELYSNSDEVIIDLSRPVILNGIENISERPDLADRAIVLNLPRIEEANRRTEADLQDGYERELPEFLGAIFDAVSQALGRWRNIDLPTKPRMADFAIWATAAEEGLELPRGSFAQAYDQNRKEAVQQTLDSDPLSAGILNWSLSQGRAGFEWTGTSGELLQLLNRVCDSSETRSPKWPRNPREIAGRLRRLSPVLRQAGIYVSFRETKASGGRRLLTIRSIEHCTATTASTGIRSEETLLVQPNDEREASGGSDCLVGDEPPPTPPPTPPHQPPPNRTRSSRRKTSPRSLDSPLKPEQAMSWSGEAEEVV